jgi:hypothetical protein
MIYHVLPGDAVAGEFQKTGITGEPIVCRECLIVGPVDAETQYEFWDQRARFIFAEYGEDEILFHELVADELERLADISDGDEVNLWFEYELFCQTNMWFCISRLADSGADIYRVEPAVRAGDEIWKGFGALTADELRQCFDERVRFAASDLQLGSGLWQAYRTGDHDRLKELNKTPSPCFPHLTEVCEAEIHKTTRPFEILREITAGGMTDIDKIFVEFSKRAGEYGFGDLQVQRLLDRL